MDPVHDAPPGATFISATREQLRLFGPAVERSGYQVSAVADADGLPHSASAAQADLLLYNQALGDTTILSSYHSMAAHPALVLLDGLVALPRVGFATSDALDVDGLEALLRHQLTPAAPLVVAPPPAAPTIAPPAAPPTSTSDAPPTSLADEQAPVITPAEAAPVQRRRRRWVVLLLLLLLVLCCGVSAVALQRSLTASGQRATRTVAESALLASAGAITPSRVTAGTVAALPAVTRGAAQAGATMPVTGADPGNAASQRPSANASSRTPAPNSLPVQIATNELAPPASAPNSAILRASAQARGDASATAGGSGGWSCSQRRERAAFAQRS